MAVIRQDEFGLYMLVGGWLARPCYPSQYKVGDKVLFGKYAGQSFKMDGQELMTMREDDIIGVVEA